MKRIVPVLAPRCSRRHWSACTRPRHRRRRSDVHQGRGADRVRQVRELPPRGRSRADVAHSPTRRCGRGRARSRTRWSRARCRRGARIPSKRCRCATTAASRKQQIETIVAWVDGGRAEGQRRRPAAAAEIHHGLDRRTRARRRSSRCRWSSTSRPKASSACRCSIRRCR